MTLTELHQKEPIYRTFYYAQRKGSKVAWTLQYFNDNEVALIDERKSGRMIYVKRPMFETNWELKEWQ